MTNRGRTPAALRHAPHLLLATATFGALLALLVPAHPWLWLPAVTGCGVGAAGALAARRPRFALAMLAGALAAAGWGWGGARLAATTPSALTLPTTVTGTVEVDTPPQATARGVRVRVRADELRGAGGRPLARGARFIAELPARAPVPVEVGMRLRITGRAVAAATARSPGWWRAHLARSAIAARLELTSTTPAGRRGGLIGLRDRLRNFGARAAGRGLSGEPREVVRGMALGGGGGLSEETAQAFRDAGLWHLLAVSGQNITVVTLAVLAVLRAVGLGRRPAATVAGVVLVAYCLACEGGASVARAGIVGGLGVAGELHSRARERWHLLLAGLAVLVLHQPRAIGDPGLQLSFAAVVGIFAVAPPLAVWFAGILPTRVADLAAQAAGATLATAPVVIWHFGRLSLAGLLVNVVAVPLAGPIVVLGLTGIGLSAVLPPLAVVADWCAGIGAWALIAIARLAAAVPGATVELPAWSAAVAVALPVGAPLLARWLWRPVGPSIARSVPRAAAVSCLAAATAIAAAAIPSSPRLSAWPHAAAVTALDVGQGDAILLRSPDGAAALVDTGPPGSPAPVLGALRRMGVRHLDVLAITHDQSDHDGAGPELLAHVDVGAVLAPVGLPALEAAARRRGIPVRRIAAGDTIAVGQWRLVVLWPKAGAPPPEDPNDASLVMRAAAAGIDALLTADAESGVLSRLPLVHVDVLKVSHHGSTDTGLARVLQRIHPTVALISVGAANRYGHPDPSTLATLRAAGLEVQRTDQVGSATVMGTPAGLGVVRERGG